jgi:hypothetical protein
MADPLSIAASAAGFISLGMSVCQGLMEYYGALRDRDTDIATMTSSIESLFKTLSYLQSYMNTATLRPSSIDRVDDCIAACNSGVESLNKKLKKIEASGTANVFERISSHAAYPFKRSTLVKLQEIISDLRSNLQLTMNLFQIEAMDLVSQKLDELTTGFSEWKTTQSQRRLNEAILMWLEGPDPSVNFNAAAKKRELGTGKWFVNGHFRDWLRSPRSFFWIQGAAGCGKTVLSSTIIMATSLETKADPDLPVLYYYFDFREAEKRTVDKMILSLIRQLCLQSEQTHVDVEKLFASCSKGLRRPSTDTLVSSLSSMLRATGFRDVYIILDALDECDETEELLEALTMLRKHQSDHTHILATSRNEKAIRDGLEPLDPVAVSIESSLVDDDIDTYLTAHLHKDRWWLKWSEEVRREVKDELSTKAKGMFRWVHCQLESLRKAKSLPILRKILQNLPRGLDETYSRILEAIDEEDRDYAVRLLQWLCFAKIAPSLQRLNEVLAVNIDDNQFEPEARFPDPHDIESICSSLVSTRIGFTGTTILELSHFSVQEYLLSGRVPEKAAMYSIEPTSAHKFMAKTCVIYLLQFADREPSSWGKADESTYPLATYAAKYWYSHLKSGDPKQTSPELTALATRLLEAGSGCYRMLRLLHQESSERRFVSPLYYAAVRDLHGIARALLESGEKPAVKPEGRHLSAFRAAVENGHVGTVRVFLDDGFDFNREHRRLKRHKKGLKAPLTVAALEGYEALATMLIDKMGTTADDVAEYFETLDSSCSGSDRRESWLEASRSSDDLELIFDSADPICALLISHMKGCMKAHEFHSLAVKLVRHAFKHQYINNLVVCLQHEIKKDSRNRDRENSSKETNGSGGTSGFDSFILDILSTCTDSSGQNVIFRLVELATTQLISRRLLKSLLESGTDPSILDMKGENLLCHYLANPRYQLKKMTLSLDVVDLLLTHNVNVNHQNRLGFPPVHLISLLNRPLLTELLLKHGARAEDVIDVGVGNQRTALHSAVELADERLILLWSEDVDPRIIDMTDKDGCTALHLASRQGHSAIVSMLLKRADKTIANNDGLTALQLAQLGFEQARSCLRSHNSLGTLRGNGLLASNDTHNRFKCERRIREFDLCVSYLENRPETLPVESPTNTEDTYKDYFPPTPGSSNSDSSHEWDIESISTQRPTLPRSS